MTPEQKSKYQAKSSDALCSRTAPELATGWMRYERLRKLNAREYAELCARNLKREGAFDDLVDLLIADEK